MRALLQDPDWVEMECRIVKSCGPGVDYAVPFVTRLGEYSEFVERHSQLLHDPIPFLESPAALIDATVDSALLPSRVSIGLKDIAQFYFARSRSDSLEHRGDTMEDPGFVRFVCESIRAIVSAGKSVSLYQSPKLLPTYAAQLKGVPWTASMNAGDYRSLQGVGANV